MTSSARIRRIFLSVVVTSAFFGAGGCASAPGTETAEASRLAVQVRFTALWWSKAQMEGLDPNNPPPKDTRVELARWEYTDPVGVPHPDVVEAIVSIQNGGAKPVSDLAVTIEGEWKIGSLEDEQRAKWGESAVLEKVSGVEIQSASSRDIPVTINLKKMMDSLEPQDRWPFALRVRVSVERPGVMGPLAKTEVDFPIRPGN